MKYAVNPCVNTRLFTQSPNLSSRNIYLRHKSCTSIRRVRCQLVPTLGNRQQAAFSMTCHWQVAFVFPWMWPTSPSSKSRKLLSCWGRLMPSQTPRAPPTSPASSSVQLLELTAWLFPSLQSHRFHTCLMPACTSCPVLEVQHKPCFGTSAMMQHQFF